MIMYAYEYVSKGVIGRIYVCMYVSERRGICEWRGYVSGVGVCM